MNQTLLLILVLTACSGAPTRLASTGLYADFASRTLAAGVQPFEPNFALWSDGAEKHRFVWLPEGTSIDTSDPDQWVFPVGTRLWKEFVVDGKPVETRFEEKTAAGWRFETYAWRADGSDATAAFWGVNRINGTAHDVPWNFDCAFCHGDHEAPLGFTAVQLAGKRESPLPSVLPLAQDEAARAALGVLSANCGGCHSDHGSQADLKLRLRLKSTDQALADTDFFKTALGHDASRTIDGLRTYVVAGNADASLLVHRFGSRGTSAQMPPIGTREQNTAGLERLRTWIEGLTP